MSKLFKTPGVYIQEINTFGNTVVPVPTAIPAFIGYTKETVYKGKSLLNKAVKVSSLAEFLTIFGSTPPQVKYKISSATIPQRRITIKSIVDFTSNGYAYYIAPTTINYRLYSSLKFFYQNGGGDCYVISVGTYDYSKSAITDIVDFTKAITMLEKEMEPTLLVIPDLIEVINKNGSTLKEKYANAYILQNEMINHCGKMMNRFAILDIPGGFNEPLVGTTSIRQFRNSVEPSDPNYKSYAAAYYPWLHTTVYQLPEVSFNNIDEQSYDQILQLLNAEFADKNGIINPDMGNIISAFSSTPKTSLKEADITLKNLSKSYQLLLDSIKENMNLMAASAGMAGIYNSVDNNRGVWKAPANIAIQSAISPAIKIDSAAQEDLNAPINGKSVCAIREFPGKGNLVWGARTLDGNSNDFRYINIRRTVMFIEQSVKDATKAYVFSPNDARTWVAVKGMLDNFLTDLWKQGGLAGAKPADAFSARVGLGVTMTNDDISNGIMRMEVLVALSRPAEFIVITFKQEMQKA